MNLLSVLLKVMLADTAISALSGKTGLSSGSLKKLLPLAIPLLLRYMTNNASTQNGALSLLGALNQHSTARSMDEMFAEADEVDGGKIVKHILGDDSARAVQTLAAESGMSDDEVNRALGGLAPALLSMLSAATNTASSQSASNTMDLSDLLGMFGGASAPASQQSVGESLLGSLLGGGMQQQSSSASLLDALLGATSVQPQVQQVQQKPQQSGGLLSSLFGFKPKPAQQQVQQVQVQPSGASLLDALLGSSAQQQSAQQGGMGLLGSLLGVTPTQQQPQQSSINSVNGNALLSLLLGAMQ